MREEIQKILDELTTSNDSRFSGFDLQIRGEENGTISLTGSLINQNQLLSLQEKLSHQFPDLRLDTASIRILDCPGRPCFHVSTNFTGFYEKPTFRVPLLSELPYGTELEVLDEKERWVFARQQDGYLGWAYKAYLTEGAALQATHLVIAPSCDLYAEPDMGSEVITRLMSGTGLQIQEIQAEWTRVIANQSGWIPSGHLRAIASLPKTVEEKRKSLLEDSQRMTGVPYLWGGLSGNGIDCSLARLLHRWIGMDIPRDADMQCAAARPVEPPFEIGDLFFIARTTTNRTSPMSASVWASWKMIHSSRSRNGVYVDDLSQGKSLMDIFWARRPQPDGILRLFRLRRHFFQLRGYLFEDFFGFGTGRRRASGPWKGPDFRYDMTISFMDAALGKEMEIDIERPETCGTCKGTAIKPGTKRETCASCKGTGQVSHSQGFFTLRTTCSRCRGQGFFIPHPCPDCRGAAK